MNVTLCDACGKTVTKNAGRFFTHIHKESHVSDEEHPQTEAFDLCHKCSDKLRGFFFDLKSDSLIGSKKGDNE